MKKKDTIKWIIKTFYCEECSTEKELYANNEDKTTVWVYCESCKKISRFDT